MVKVFMPKPREDWVCDVIIDEFERNTTHQIVRSIAEADVVWHYAKWMANHHPNTARGNPGHKPTITTVHHIVPEKFNPNEVKALDAFTDIYHVPNVITQRMLGYATVTPIRRLPYWVNDRRFPPRLERKRGQRKVIGSFQRDTEGSDLKSPKLEKGPDILGDVIDGLDPFQYQVLLAGWRRQYIIGRLGDRMPYDYLERAPDIAGLYGMCDYYLVTSRHEGGPQALLEAAQSRVMVLSTPVGLAEELLHPDCICRSVVDFRLKLDAGLDRIEENYQRVQAYTLDRMIGRYDELVQEVYNNAKR